MFNKQDLFNKYYDNYMCKVAYSANMDTYNRRYANIANPSQINRWKANGFSDSQIRQYTDNKVRNSMGGFSPYGSAPNPYNSTYTKRYNNIANPAQIARWRAKGFSDAQIRAYTDSQVRKSMTSRGY